MGNEEHRRRSNDDKGHRDSRDDRKGHDHDRRKSSGRDERRHSDERDRRHSDERDRRHSDEHYRRHSSDRRRSSNNEDNYDRRHSNDEDKDGYLGEHNDFFRRLSAIVAYDAEYRRDSQKERKPSDGNDDNHKRVSEDRRDSQKEKYRRYSEKSDRRNSRNDHENRRYSEESDRRNSHNDDEHRVSIPRELLDFEQKVQKTEANGPGHSRFHQRWMFLWPFGKKENEDTTTGNPVNTNGANANKNPKGNKQEAINQQNQKKGYETEGVQTVDDSLLAPSSAISKLKPIMKSDNVQTSFANFGLLPPNTSRKTNDSMSKSGTGTSGIPLSLRDNGVQTIETKIKLSTHTIQTSFENFFDSGKKKKNMKDSMTSMNFKNGRVMMPRKRMGRTINAVPRSSKESLHSAQNNEQPEPEAMEAENAQCQSPTSSGSLQHPPQSRQAGRSQSKSTLCPICKRGYYVSQISLSGCLAAVLCLLCCGPCWCRRCCDVTVCDYCGCSKSFYRPKKDEK